MTPRIEARPRQTRFIRTTFLLATLSLPVLCAAREVHAQAPLRNVPAQEQPRDASAAGTAFGALLGGGVGFVAGVYLGAQGDCYEICWNIVLGALIGEVVGASIGAHAGNGGRGSFAATFGAAAGVSLLGVAATSQASSDRVLLGAAFAQIVAVTITQVATSPRLGVAPVVRTGPEGIGLGVELRW